MGGWGAGVGKTGTLRARTKCIGVWCVCVPTGGDSPGPVTADFSVGVSLEVTRRKGVRTLQGPPRDDPSQGTQPEHRGGRGLPPALPEIPHSPRSRLLPF